MTNQRKSLTAGCGCRGNTRRVYEVTYPDGTKETVPSMVAAMKAVRAKGGKYTTRTVPR